MWLLVTVCPDQDVGIGAQRLRDSNPAPTRAVQEITAIEIQRLDHGAYDFLPKYSYQLT